MICGFELLQPLGPLRQFFFFFFVGGGGGGGGGGGSLFSQSASFNPRVNIEYPSDKLSQQPKKMPAEGGTVIGQHSIPEESRPLHVKGN